VCGLRRQHRFHDGGRRLLRLLPPVLAAAALATASKS
jgi:hypothetical protein